LNETLSYFLARNSDSFNNLINHALIQIHTAQSFLQQPSRLKKITCAVAYSFS